jgi:CarD family transcriptional regulator, regulator of rRNA transcription
MFMVKEKVVYPGHGVAQIDRVVEKNVGGRPTTFFELRLLNKDMTVLVPTNNLKAAGIRRLSTQARIKNVFALLSERPKKDLCSEMLSNWNKRNKDYQCRLRSGDLFEICKIYRDLKCIERQKELSFGERNLLMQTEHLLAEEIAFVSDSVEEKTVARLRSYFSVSAR